MTYTIQTTITADTRPFTRGTRRAEQAADKFRNRLDQTDRSARKAAGGIGATAGAAGALKTAIAGLSFGLLLRQTTQITRGILNTRKQFEDLRNTLTVLSGGVQQADRDFELIRDFASTTQFSVQELVQGFSLLRAVGIDPTTDSLKGLGEIASAFSREFGDVVLAAISGEAETLKKLGITLRRNGEEATLIYKGVSQNLVNDNKVITQAIIDLGNTALTGSIALAANSISTLESNVGDAREGFEEMIATSRGMDDAWKELNRTVIELFNSNDELAKAIGEDLADALNAITDILKSGVIQNSLAEIYETLSNIASIGGGALAGGILGKLSKFAAGAATGGARGSRLGWLGALIGGTIGGISSSRDDDDELLPFELRRMLKVAEKRAETLRGDISNAEQLQDAGINQPNLPSMRNQLMNMNDHINRLQREINIRRAAEPPEQDYVDLGFVSPHDTAVGFAPPGMALPTERNMQEIMGRNFGSYLDDIREANRLELMRAQGLDHLIEQEEAINRVRAEARERYGENIELTKLQEDAIRNLIITQQQQLEQMELVSAGADRFGDVATRSFDALLDNTKSFADAFKSILRDIVLDLIRAQIRMQAVQFFTGLFAPAPAFTDIGAGAGGVGGGFTSINHYGGMPGQAAMRYDEVPTVLRRDEEVLNTSDPRHRRNRGMSGGMSGGGATYNLDLAVYGEASEAQVEGAVARAMSAAVPGIIRASADITRGELIEDSIDGSNNGGF
ncbi:MAG: hypothetical protein J4F41_00235 [Alphaproteobacteria bacterium]|nr:hypothetical protein [Alphaproteobacteria bacterium]